ncbi:MAG: histidine phosphatase family protein [Clostridia bacterium]|nr:histidine phosphatase family protein [Clostridia bacterium]
MRIIFVRHGHPDYKNDCLTELGHLHAEAAARRLSGEKIARIYASSCGRAYETAEHIAAPRGMEVEKCDFMRELRWGSIDEEPLFEKGHPWYTADDMVARGQNVADLAWPEQEPFCRNKVVTYAKAAEEGFDQWLAALGYEREGLYYRVRRCNPDTVLMASHGGSSSAVLAHLLNLTFPYICATIKPDFTAITVLSFEGAEGSLISPIIEILNDARHIADIQGDAVYGQ